MSRPSRCNIICVVRCRPKAKLIGLNIFCIVFTVHIWLKELSHGYRQKVLNKAFTLLYSAHDLPSISNSWTTCPYIPSIGIQLPSLVKGQSELVQTLKALVLSLPADLPSTATIDSKNFPSLPIDVRTPQLQLYSMPIPTTLQETPPCACLLVDDEEEEITPTIGAEDDEKRALIVLLQHPISTTTLLPTTEHP